MAVVNFSSVRKHTSKSSREGHYFRKLRKWCKYQCTITVSTLTYCWPPQICACIPGWWNESHPTTESRSSVHTWRSSRWSSLGGETARQLKGQIRVKACWKHMHRCGYKKKKRKRNVRAALIKGLGARRKERKRQDKEGKTTGRGGTRVCG